MANDPSVFEYTLKDSQVSAVATSGARFPFSNRIGDHSHDPGGESTRGRGSSATMTYHTGVLYDHQFTFKVPIDESQRFREWFDINCAKDGVCNFERRRSKPRVRTVVDIMKDYLPIFGEESFAEGDATMVEISGGFLTIEYDITSSITA